MKTALITGSSQGIGAATARLFRKEGYFVFLHGRKLKELEALEKELGQKDSILCFDLKNTNEIDQMCKKIEDHVKFQGLKFQALINNAGIFRTREKNPTTDQTWNQWIEQFHVNLFAAARLTEKLIPLLAQHAPSSIVNVSSSASLRPTPNFSAYSASKAAMNHWTLSLASELGPQQIRVNAVLPGLVDTPIHSFNELPPDEKAKTKKELGALQVMGRIGEATEIAESIFFLASQKSKWTTGSLLTVDGGISVS